MKRNFLALLVAIFSLFLATVFAPPVERETSLGELRFQISPALRGGGDLYVPLADWGVRFPLHRSPFLLEGEVRSVNREGLLYAASGQNVLLDNAEKEISSGAQQTIFRTLLLALLFSLLLGTLLLRYTQNLGPRFSLRSLLYTALISALLLLLAGWTYSPKSLKQPSFYAQGEELGQILDAFSKNGASSSYEGNFRKVLKDVSAFLADQPLPEGDVSFVLASDIHANALAFPALRAFAREKPLFLPGDFGLEGNDAEAALLAPEIAALGKEVFAVSGNHDSTALMRRLAEAGVIVLGRRGRLLPSGSWQGGAVRTEGLSVRGWEDPLEWSGGPADPLRPYSLDPEGRKKAERDLYRWWRGLARKPDLLMIHQAPLAESLALRIQNHPKPLTILVGHDHKQWVSKSGNIRIVDAGSAGAGGIFGFGRETADMAEIYFAQASRKLEVVDMIRVSPLDGRASAERVIPDEICSLPCRYEPEGIR